MGEIYCAICGSTFSSELHIDCEETDEDAYSMAAIGDDEDLEWLDRLQALGINPDASGRNKSFLTGEGYHEDFGFIHVAPGEDPSLPPYNEDLHLVSYYDWSGLGQTPVFPVHRDCYQEILRRCIFLDENEELNGDILYSVFNGLQISPYIRLQLDYGQPKPDSTQVWKCCRGEEVLVMNPVHIPQLLPYLDSVKEHVNKDTPNSKSHLKDPKPKDLFNKLPQELRHELFKRLPAASILALKAASWTMHITALPKDLWTKKLGAEAPWLWEIHDINPFQSQELEAALSQTLQVVDVQSQYKRATFDYFGGLVNRRRIWEVCEQIRDLYLEKSKEVVA